MSDDPDRGSDGLGSLSQKARTKSLKSARWILIIIGVLYLLIYGFMFSRAEQEVDRELEKMGLNVNTVAEPGKFHEARATFIKTVRLIYGGFAGMAVAMIACGIFVYKAPVVCTVLGLVVYLAGWLIPVVLLFLGDNPEDAGRALYGGIIIKIAIIIGLSKAIQSAVAYQQEKAGEY